VSSSAKTLRNLDPAPQHKMRVREILLLSCSVLSLVLSCIVWSSRKQEWVDEIYTWTEVNDRSLWHLLYAIQHGADGGMPLFYTTAWVWARAFGSGPLALRLYSCVAFCGAFVLLWRTIRRAYGARATAFGLLLVWATSALTLDLNAEARFYGLYTLMVAISVAFYMRLAEEERPTPLLLAGAMLAQAGLVLSHVLGILYGALILLALILFDASRRRFRLTVYLFHAAGWLALLVWLPAIRASMAVGRPHGWIPMPTLSNIVASFNFQMWLVPILVVQQHYDGFLIQAMLGLVLILVAVALLTVIVRLGRSLMSGSQQLHSDRQIPLLIVALSILTTPLVLLIFSHLVTPIYVRRYTIPGTIGLAIIFVAFAAETGADRIKKLYSAPGLAWTAMVTVLVAMPVLFAMIVGYPEINSEYLDVPRLDALIPGNVSVVVVWQHDFFKVMRYSNRADRPYLFLLDWPTALNGEESFVTDFHLMANYRQVGYYSSNIKDQLDFVCTHPYFLVVDNQSSSWFAAAEKEFPGLKSEDIATVDEDRELIAVRWNESLAACEERFDHSHGQTTAG
jgi:Dolichyl-phosphate-mannose-protein mannosyltransferase